MQKRIQHFFTVEFSCLEQQRCCLKTQEINGKQDASGVRPDAEAGVPRIPGAASTPFFSHCYLHWSVCVQKYNISTYSVGIEKGAEFMGRIFADTNGGWLFVFLVQTRGGRYLPKDMFAEVAA